MLKYKLSRLYQCKHLNFRRLINTSNVNSNILSDLFGLTPSESMVFVEKNKLQKVDGELMINSINFCKSIGYTNEEILDTPRLLRLHPLQLEQNYLTLEEGAFQEIHPTILSRARYLMKTIINILKERNIIPVAVNVPNHFLKYIEDTEISNKIPIKGFTDEDLWSDVHKHILKSFLRMRLNATEDEIIKLFRIHKMIKNKSFRIIQENIAIAEDLGFDNKKILANGYLLHNYPKYPKTVLRDFPNLAGADMRRAMWLYPKLVMASPSNIIKIYGILKSFNIEDEFIRKHMNIFHLSPETVRLRLEEIERSPDLSGMLKHPKILSFIVHHNRAKSRLTFLQNLQLKCASYVVLGTNIDEVFNDYVREGKDVNRISDINIFLKKLLNVSEDYIKTKFRNHPCCLQVPLKNMQHTYDYLTCLGYQPADITKVIHILLYPQEKIEKILNEKKTEINFDSLTDVKKMRTVLYFIEKEHHFTGNGIWKDLDNVDINLSEKSHE